MTPAETIETRQESGRLVAFSDGVVAIAITLLILPLAAIELPPHDPAVEANPLGYLWDQNSSLITSFLISWFVILTFWLGHHSMMGTVSRVNRNMIMWNTMWLFGIIVLPFPMNLLNQVGSGDDSIASRQTATFYIGTLAFISLMLMLMSLELRRNPELLKPELRDNPPLRSVRSPIVTGYLILLIPFAWLFPIYSLWGLLGLTFLGPVANSIDELRYADRQTRDEEKA